MSNIITSGHLDNAKITKIQETWTLSLHDLTELLNKGIIEIHSPPKTLSAEYDFKLKIEFQKAKPPSLFVANYEIHFYYMCPSPIFLKSVKLNIFYKKDDEEEKCCEYLETELKANKWQLLCKTNYKQLQHRLGNSKNIRLNFEFDVTEKKFNIPTTELSDDMENLFLERMYSDLVMKSADGEEFKCHKAVLAFRCPVLEAEFELNTTECTVNSVESSLESAVLREVLFFIYTDKAPIVDEISEKLLAAADYYQLTRLKSLCEEALHKKLTIDNAIETLQLADLHSANTLEQLALEFIREHQRQITKTEGWTKLQSVEMLKKIFE